MKQSGRCGAILRTLTSSVTPIWERDVADSFRRFAESAEFDAVAFDPGWQTRRGDCTGPGGTGPGWPRQRLYELEAGRVIGAEPDESGTDRSSRAMGCGARTRGHRPVASNCLCPMPQSTSCTHARC